MHYNNNSSKHILSWTDDKLLAAAAGNVSALLKLLEAAEDSLLADGKLLVTADSNGALKINL